MQKDFFRLLGYSDEKSSELACKLDEQLCSDIKFYRDIGCSLIQSEYLAKNVFNIVDTYRAPARLSVPKGFTGNIESCNIVHEEDTNFEEYSVKEDPFIIGGNTKEDKNGFIEVSSKPDINIEYTLANSEYTKIKEQILNKTKLNFETLEDSLGEDIINNLDYNIDKTITTEIHKIDNKDFLFVGVKAPRENIIEPLDIIIIVDTSMSMQDKAVKMQKCIMGIASKLGENDTLSIISYWDKTKTVANRLNRDTISDVILALSDMEFYGKSDECCGLVRAFEMSKDTLLKSQIIVITDYKETIKSLEYTISQEITSSNSSVSFIDVGDSAVGDTILNDLATVGKGQYFKVIDDLDIKNMLESINIGCNIQTNDVNIQVKFNSKDVKRYKILGDNKLQRYKFVDDTYKNEFYIVLVVVFEIEFTSNKGKRDICNIEFGYKDTYKSNKTLKTHVVKNDTKDNSDNILKILLAMKFVELAKCEYKEQLYKEFCNIYDKIKSIDDKLVELKKLAGILCAKL